MVRIAAAYGIENSAVKAFMISGAIAIGLVFSEVINQIIRKSER